MTFLEQKIRDAHTAGRTALIPFVTAGFPTLDTFWGIIEELDANGADVIEIGVPFSDPVADGRGGRFPPRAGTGRQPELDHGRPQAARRELQGGHRAHGLPQSVPPVRAGTLRRRCRTSGRLRLHRAGSAA